jgi:hypothetical protein
LETITQGSEGKFSFPSMITSIPQVKDKNQLANLGHKENIFNLLFKDKKGPIVQAAKLANNPELR